MSKTVAIYVRVSTGKQADRDSIPFQIQECSNYVKHFLKTENFEVFKDAGRSGKNTHRPEYQRMIEKVKSGMISHVVVYKIDRISRNLVDFSIMYNDFKEHKVAFISLNEQFDTSSAIGEAVLKIILVFAELERKRYTAAPYTVIRSGDSDALTAKRDKTIRALERLKKLFLFEDDAMSEKEYLMSKRELEGTLSDIENELSALEADTADTKYDDMSFISTASGFLIAHQIASGEHINYRELACAVDAKVLKDFVNSVIERIVLLDGRVASIEFKNGLVHEFLYRE